MQLSRFLLTLALFSLLPGVSLAQQHEVPVVAHDARSQTTLLSDPQQPHPTSWEYSNSQSQEYYLPQSGAFYGSTTYSEIRSGPYEYWRRPDWSFYMARPGSSVESTTSLSRGHSPCRRGEHCYRGRPSHYGNGREYGYGDLKKSSRGGSSRSPN